MDNPTFEDLAKLSHREIQVLLREVDQNDLVVALKDASPAIRDKMLGNMSARVRGFITDEIEYLKPMQPAEIAEVRGRIVQQFLKLVEQGQCEWPTAKSGKKPRAKRKPSKELAESKRRLRNTVTRRLDELSLQEMDGLFRDLAEVARGEGILALEAYAEKMSDTFMRSGLLLAVDGTEPDLIMDILETWLESLAHEHERKHRKVIEGLMSIQSGDNPRTVEHKLSVIF